MSKHSQMLKVELAKLLTSREEIEEANRIKEAAASQASQPHSANQKGATESTESNKSTQTDEPSSLATLAEQIDLGAPRPTAASQDSLGGSKIPPAEPPLSSVGEHPEGQVSVDPSSPKALAPLDKELEDYPLERGEICDDGMHNHEDKEGCIYHDIPKIPAVRCRVCLIGIDRYHEAINDRICDNCHFSLKFGRILTPKELEIVLSKTKPLTDSWGEEVTFDFEFLDSILTKDLNSHIIGFLLNTPWWTIAGIDPSPLLVHFQTSQAPLVRGGILKEDLVRLKEQLGPDDLEETGIMDALLENWKLHRIPVTLHRFTVNDGFYVHGTITPAVDEKILEASTPVPSRKVVFLRHSEAAKKGSTKATQEDLLLSLVKGL